MTEECEDFLINMKTHLKKLHKHRTNVDAMQNKLSEGRIEIHSLTTTVRSHVYNLADILGYVIFLTKKSKLHYFVLEVTLQLDNQIVKYQEVLQRQLQVALHHLR